MTGMAASAFAAASSTRLKLMWLASPALPVGGFSYSEGLEAAVDAGLVSDEASARAWLVDQLHVAVARSDLAVMRRAFDAWSASDAEAATSLNRWVASTRETAELRLQTEQMGRSLAVWLKNLSLVGEAGAAHDARIDRLTAMEPAPTWPVAFALATVLTGAGLHDAMLSLAFGWAENMTQSAIKCVPLGQLAGQRILEALIAEIPSAIATAELLAEDERQAFAPMLAILSARHETQYSRLFRS